jgi:hypothetical protein
MKPWTIKSVATRVSEDITATARRENLTTGQLLEKVWDAWKAGGWQATKETNVTLIADLSSLLHAVGSLPEHTPVPREVRALINDYARMARGLPGLQLGQTQGVLPGQKHGQTAIAVDGLPGQQPGLPN